MGTKSRNRAGVRRSFPEQEHCRPSLAGGPLSILAPGRCEGLGEGGRHLRRRPQQPEGTVARPPGEAHPASCWRGSRDRQTHSCALKDSAEQWVQIKPGSSLAGTSLGLFLWSEPSPELRYSRLFHTLEGVSVSLY